MWCLERPYLFQNLQKMCLVWEIRSCNMKIEGNEGGKRKRAKKGRKRVQLEEQQRERRVKIGNYQNLAVSKI